MIPYLLAAVGAYLIGSSGGVESFAAGGWVNGIYLDNDQILAITTTDFGGQQRYYFNKKVNKFIPVISMSSYNIDEFNCRKDDIERAKSCALSQNLKPDIDFGKVRAKSFGKGGVVEWVKDQDKYNKWWGRQGNHKTFGECIGAFDIKGWRSEAFLYNIDDHDREYWKKALSELRRNEMLFRYETDTTKIGGFTPVIKINLEKNLIYFLKDLYADDDVNIVFETRGVKPSWISLSDKVYAQLSRQPNYHMTDKF